MEEHTQTPPPSESPWFEIKGNLLVVGRDRWLLGEVRKYTHGYEGLALHFGGSVYEVIEPHVGPPNMEFSERQNRKEAMIKQLIDALDAYFTGDHEKRRLAARARRIAASLLGSEGNPITPDPL